MNEAEWKACTDTQQMLEFLSGQVSERKLGLFAAACWRRTALVRNNPACGEAVAAAERHADGVAAREELEAALDTAIRSLPFPAQYVPPGIARIATTAGLTWILTSGPGLAAQVLAFEAVSPNVAGVSAGTALLSRLVAQHTLMGGIQQAAAGILREQAVLLRHLVGNPFQPYPAPGAWPMTVAELAEALYAGQDNRLILADALEESGHEQLAAHFRQEEAHPKGCFALDAILGRN